MWRATRNLRWLFLCPCVAMERKARREKGAMFPYRMTTLLSLPERFWKKPLIPLRRLILSWTLTRLRRLWMPFPRQNGFCSSVLALPCWPRWRRWISSIELSRRFTVRRWWVSSWWVPLLWKEEMWPWFSPIPVRPEILWRLQSWRRSPVPLWYPSLVSRSRSLRIIRIFYCFAEPMWVLCRKAPPPQKSVSSSW